MSASPQISVLRSQAAQVFRRKGFKLAVWVGALFSSEIVTLLSSSIIYDPKYYAFNFGPKVKQAFLER
jgi:hypothetical protein